MNKCDKKDQKAYKIRNWKEYNKALVKRGRIDIWIDEDSTKGWYSKYNTGKKGRPKTYSKEAILCSLMVRSVFHLPLRSLEGFLNSIIDLMSVNIKIPNYSQICRRAKDLGKNLEKLSKKQPTDIVIDSTGVKMYGEGEWKIKQHGKSKRRTWRKIHLAVCPKTHSIIMSELTESNVVDSKVGSKMIDKLPKNVKKVYADGAYDTSQCYKSANQKQKKLVTPPRINAKPTNLLDKPWMKARNDAIEYIRKSGDDECARKKWKESVSYNKRSLAETAMFRFKKIFGGSMQSIDISSQKAELYAKSVVMNVVTDQGMPKGEWIKVS